ncbi:hypothetical protein BJV82DRAFT_715467 [Fennellomyces sp. T-0311]|nr:hypothetical protein BJV82DRAFT_715467 [Fennellomyces sp. T-0311]
MDLENGIVASDDVEVIEIIGSSMDPITVIRTKIGKLWQPDTNDMLKMELPFFRTGVEDQLITSQAVFPTFVLPPVSTEMREIIEQLVERDLNWTNIKNIIRLDKKRLGEIVSGDYSKIPHSLRITYQESGTLGLKTAQEEGYWTFKNLSTYQEGMFLFAFMSKWQRSVIYLNGGIACLDSTHRTCVDGADSHCYLYNIVTRCQETRKGSPLCWMVTNSDSQYSVEFWPKWLKDDMRFQP